MTERICRCSTILFVSAVTFCRAFAPCISVSGGLAAHKTLLKGSPFDYQYLQFRIDQIQLEEQWKLPPNNPNLSPYEFCESILELLSRGEDGFLTLLRSSTPRWRHMIYQSVGAPPTASPKLVASALSTTLLNTFEDNQFGILLESDLFECEFPSDVFGDDDTCWFECRFRASDNNGSNSLWVITGWSLVKDPCGSGTWMLDGVEWQDFRDRFRPGIGREEWMMEVPR